MDAIQEIQNRIDQLLLTKERVIVALEGRCAAGKSTLAGMLAEHYGANLFRMEDFCLPPERRTYRRLCEVGGDVDYERFDHEVLKHLKRGEVFFYRPFDCLSGKFGGLVAIGRERVNIVEGTYSMHPYFGDPYDLRVFLDVDGEVQRQRIEDNLSMRQILAMRRLMEQEYFEGFEIPQKCDLRLG